MIEVEVTGSTKNAQSFLSSVSNLDSDIRSACEAAGQRGVEALAAATPVASGLTAASWTYEIESKKGETSIYWLNTNVVSGANVAILLQYGHGTGTGGYIAGRDYINPAIQSVFDQIAEDVWKKVTSA